LSEPAPKIAMVRRLLQPRPHRRALLAQRAKSPMPRLEAGRLLLLGYVISIGLMTVAQHCQRPGGFLAPRGSATDRVPEHQEHALEP
jgi:hypothetical protein